MAAPAPSFDLQQTLDRIESSGRLSRQDYLSLVKCLLSDYKMDDDQRRAINRILERVQHRRLMITER